MEPGHLAVYLHVYSIWNYRRSCQLLRLDMQHSPNIIERLARDFTLSDKNAGEPNHAGAIIVRLDLLPTFVDPYNWEWKDESKAVWMPAEENWQKFCTKWYGVTESQSASPEFPLLSLEPLPELDLSTSSSILVRESYVTMFDTVWARAISSRGRKGVIIAGQPGIGAYLLSHIHYIA